MIGGRTISRAPYVKQREGVSPHSRGAMRPGFAF